MIMHNQDSLKVGTVAKAAGVGVQTLRYYERLGLLAKPTVPRQIIGSTRRKRSVVCDSSKKRRLWA